MDTSPWVTVVGLVVAAIPPTILAWAALRAANNNKAAIEKSIDETRQLHVSVDGRLTQLLEQTGKAEHSAGVTAGIAQGFARGVATSQVVKDAHAEGVLEGNKPPTP